MTYVTTSREGGGVLRNTQRKTGERGIDTGRVIVIARIPREEYSQAGIGREIVVSSDNAKWLRHFNPIASQTV